MRELIGKLCSCDFDLPYTQWPISGYPAFVVVEDFEPPLIKLRPRVGSAMWINLSQIKQISDTGQLP